MLPRGTLTYRDLSQRLRLTRQAIARGVAAGHIPPPIRVGRNVRWPVEAIEAWADGGGTAPEGNTLGEGGVV
jgi:predicted DNA-binding transcriptional regulator AlpA